MPQTRGALLGATLMSFGNVVRISLQLISIPILARLLGPGVYGLVAFAMAIISFGAVLSETGLSGAIARGVPLTQRMTSTIFWVTVLSGASFMCLIDLGVLALWRLLPKDGGAVVVLALSPVLLSSAMLSLPSGLIIRGEKFWAFALSDIVSVTLSSLLAIGLAVKGAGIWALVAQALVLTNTKLLILFIVSRPRVGLAFDLSEIRSMVTFGVHSVLANISTFISRTVDNVIIGSFLGPTNLGWYAMAYQISWMPDGVLSGPVYASIIPVIGRNETDPVAVKRLFLASFSLVSAIIIPTFAGIALTADLTVPLFLGDKWLPSIILLRTLSLAGCVNCLFTIVGVSLLATGHSRDQLFLTLYVAVAVVISVLIGILFGVNGVAVAVSVASVTAAPMYFYRAWTRFQCSVREIVSRATLPASAALSMTVVIFLLRAFMPSTLEKFIQLPLVIAGGGLTYVAVMAVFGGRSLMLNLRQFREG